MTDPAPRYVVFGDRVRRARLGLRLNQSELGRLLWPPTNAATVGRWEAGETMPVGPVRHSLPEVLGMPYWELFDPLETADDLTPDQAQLLLSAVHVQSHPHGWFVRVEGKDQGAHAEALARLNLLASSGKERGRPFWLFRLTAPGEEVRDLLVKMREGLGQ